MASGSTVTMTGATNMTQVVSGDVIDDADFNNMRTNIGLMMGTAQMYNSLPVVHLIILQHMVGDKAEQVLVLFQQVK